MSGDCGAAGLAALTCRLLLGTVFLASGIAKLVSPTSARDVVAQLMPAASDITRIDEVLAVILGCLEMALGAALVVGFDTRYAAGAAAVILVGFIGALLWLMKRNFAGSCSCFGSVGHGDIDGLLITRNLTLMTMAVYLGRQALRDTACANALAWQVDLAKWAGAVIAAGVLVVVAAFVTEVRRWHKARVV
jgi:uncharacterized membrane protein YphA (DoxX/SURF4 family)